MRYALLKAGESRSFPMADPFLASAVQSPTADVVVVIGRPLPQDQNKAAILVELGNESLGVHTGESMGNEGSNIVGFSRYRNGDDPPSQLIELVRQPATSEEAIAAARALFEGHGYTVVVCADQPGRIIDRLVRPKYNAALRFLDEGLASQEDLDTTCRLGLGYADGPVERVTRGGLAHHYDVTSAIFAVTGAAGFAPARRAAVAKARSAKS